MAAVAAKTSPQRGKRVTGGAAGLAKAGGEEVGSGFGVWVAPRRLALSSAVWDIDFHGTHSPSGETDLYPSNGQRPGEATQTAP